MDGRWMMMDEGVCFVLFHLSAKDVLCCVVGGNQEKRKGCMEWLGAGAGVGG